MSWGKVKKINSDMNEPLNNVLSVYTISADQENNYVMSPENKAAWDRLALDSCYLYGHRGIHQSVYARLTDENIDALVEKSGKLGQQLNAFYQTDLFAVGNITDVLQSMTIEAYNLLEEKFKDGFARYLDKKMTASTCGTWLNDTFALESETLAGMTTIAQIAADNEITNTILANQAASVAYACSPAVCAVIGENDAYATNISNGLVQLIELSGFVENISENANWVNVILNNEAALAALTENSDAMRVIFSSVVGFEQVVSNAEALTTIFSSDTAVGVFGAIYQEIVDGSHRRQPG